jgi:tetratricopeptide (TPR) repeat protein
MLGIHDTQKRCVIPKWRPLDDISKRRDIEMPRTKPFLLSPSTVSKLEADYREFTLNPNPFIASDIMGAAYVVGEVRIATEMARHVKKSSILLKPTIELANRILHGEDAVRPVDNIQIRISQLKRKLYQSPKNPLLSVELARLYTIKGQLEKASRSIVTALALAPSNRYVIRSAARFYIHCGDLESAWHYVKRALALCYDPWIDATLINIGLMLKKSPPQSSRKTPMTVPDASVFCYSELLESHGILELNSGNEQKAKKCFKVAWKDPSENVVTHGEWVLRNILTGLLSSVKLDLHSSPEAEAWNHFGMLNLEPSMNAIRDWGLQEPFSRHPWLLGSAVACHLSRYQEAAEQAKLGLLANPRDFLLHNNLAFALIKSGKRQEAEAVLKSSPEPEPGAEVVVDLATRALLEYKNGNIVKGRCLYLEAIDECDKIQNTRLKTKALLNLAIAEVEVNGDRALEFVTSGIEATLKYTDPDVTLTIRELAKVIKSKSNSWLSLIGSQKGGQKQQADKMLQVIDDVKEQPNTKGKWS